MVSQMGQGNSLRLVNSRSTQVVQLSRKNPSKIWWNNWVSWWEMHHVSIPIQVAVEIEAQTKEVTPSDSSTCTVTPTYNWWPQPTVALVCNVLCDVRLDESPSAVPQIAQRNRSSSLSLLSICNKLFLIFCLLDWDVSRFFREQNLVHDVIKVLHTYTHKIYSSMYISIRFLGSTLSKVQVQDSSIQKIWRAECCFMLLKSLLHLMKQSKMHRVDSVVFNYFTTDIMCSSYIYIYINTKFGRTH